MTTVTDPRTEEIEVPCWAVREDVIGRQAAIDSMPDCGPCSCDPNSYDGVECVWQWIKAMCDLTEGHQGEHQYLEPDKIVLVFGPRRPAAGEGR